MDYFKHTFNEDSWNIYLIDDDDHHISDEDASAETDFDNKEMFFRRSALTLKIVRHEIWHLYFGYCYLSDANLDAEQMEEVSAALFEDKGERMFAVSKLIYDKLQELKLNETKA